MKAFSHLFVLRLDQQRYALQLAAVSRVVRMVEITPLPRARKALLGLVNVQGEILPVVDLRSCLNHQRRPVTPEDVLVIVQAEGGKVALPADAVGGVLDPAGHLLLWETERPGQSEFLAGLVKLPGGMVMLFDLEKIASLCGEFGSAALLAPPQQGEPPGGESWAELAEVEAGAGRKPPVVPGDSSAAEEGDSKTLRERARKLAREPVPASHGQRLEVVEFALSDERYAVESAFIREVYPLKELTPLPCTPPFVLGIVNLRGKILSVVDLRTFFELAGRGLSDLNKVIVLASASMEFGLLADHIVGVRTIDRSELQPALPTLTDLRADYLKGVTRERLVVLDGGRMLADGRIVVHEEA
ncbi:MAG TPA: chemotaxis protein CheW [Geomonas sp.]|nr:chemotaxis protein CheW [Geomonas sp.]